MSIDTSKKLQYRFNGEIYPEVARFEINHPGWWLIVFKRPSGFHLQTIIRSDKELDASIEEASTVVPWKDIKSVPVNCWFRHKTDDTIAKITSIYGNSVYLYGAVYTLDKLFNDFEYTKGVEPLNTKNIWLPYGEIE